MGFSGRSIWGDRVARRRREDEAVAVVKRDEMTSPALPSADLNALLGRGCEFEGKLSFEGKVRIDGRFDGQIITNDILVIGEEARISAEISCGTLISHGEMVGNVRAKNAVELHRPARLKGNITTPSLMIEKGMLFDGQSKMEGAEVSPGRTSAVEAEPAPANVTPITAATRAAEKGSG